MKFRVKFKRKIVGRETIECLIRAEDLADAREKFDAEDFVKYLVTERLLSESDVVEGPVFSPVYEIE